MKIINVLLSMLVLFFMVSLGRALVIDASAEMLEENGFTYVLLENGTAEITGYKGTDAVVTVPTKIAGIDVTSIGDRAFSMKGSAEIDNQIAKVNRAQEAYERHKKWGKDTNTLNKDIKKIEKEQSALDELRKKVDYLQIEEINLPASIIYIGEEAFAFCKLNTMNLPNGVIEIGDRAFANCSQMKYIMLPESVISIGNSVFAGCNSLMTIEVSPENKVLSSIDGVLFSKMDRKLVTYPLGSLQCEYEIPNGILQIGDSAFENNTLETVILPESIIEIGKKAFSSCWRITSMCIPKNVEVIGKGAFAYCTNLETVDLPDKVVLIDDEVFSGCRSLKSVTLSPDLQSINKDAFHGCTELESIVLTDKISEIDSSAFGICDKLTITVTRDSYAADYCKNQGLSYVYSDANDWLGVH